MRVLNFFILLKISFVGWKHSIITFKAVLWITVLAISNFFTLERGVRQGDPLSPYLFTIVVETLAIAIRQNEVIKGIKIGNEKTKLLQFADDTTAVLSDTDSTVKLFEIINLFEIISGLKINCSKTMHACG